MKTSVYSRETKTVIKMFERLPAVRRKHLLERIQEMMLEQEGENKWDELFENNPEPMVNLAKITLKEHKQGRSKQVKI